MRVSLGAERGFWLRSGLTCAGIRSYRPVRMRSATASGWSASTCLKRQLSPRLQLPWFRYEKHTRVSPPLAVVAGSFTMASAACACTDARHTS
eukprot:3291390-Pleurochrysis_carterae.AAC.3